MKHLIIYQTTADHTSKVKIIPLITTTKQSLGRNLNMKGEDYPVTDLKNP